MKFSLAFLIALALSGAVNVKASPVSSEHELHQVFEEFLALVPVDKVAEIFVQYVENDSEVQAAIAYVGSDGFKQLVSAVENIDDVISFYDFLQESGLNVYGLVNQLHDQIGLPPLVPGKPTRSLKLTGGVAGLIADIKAVLPLEDIKALFYAKLETSPAFANLVERLHSPRFQQLINALRANEEFRKILAFAKEAGVDVKAVMNLLGVVFGLEFPESRVARVNEDLVQDFADFVAYIPLEQMIDVVVDYVFNDPEVQKAAAFVRSEEYKTLTTNAQQNVPFRRFLGYLESAGAPATKYVNKLNEVFGRPIVHPLEVRSYRIAGPGVRGMLDALKVLLPESEIDKFYQDKMKTSKAFAQYIERLHTKEFQSIVDDVVNNEDFQKLGYRVADFGIDLKTIASFLWKFFGIHISPELLPRRMAGTLDNDLQEFVNLVPVKKIRKIAIKHYLFDREFKRAYRYVQSPEFHDLIRYLRDVPEYQATLAALEEAGLDVEAVLVKIHEAIGFPDARSMQHLGEARGVASFVSEVKAVLPISDIKALYHKKLETSPAFARVAELISSAEFQAVTNALFGNPTFQHILHKLQSYGVNLNAVADFFLTVFGINTPPGVIDTRV